MTKHKNKHSLTKTLLNLILGLIALGLCIAMFLHGTDVALFNPKGLIALEEHKLIIFTVAMLLSIAVPTITLLYFTAWKYRETNEKATYNPHTSHGKFFVFSLWAIPTIFILFLISVMWPATHRLEPRKSVDPNTKPLTIQVVAMRWKWLFIYPEQNIATVNFVEIPKDTPVEFDLTADETPMSSFWVPHLAGQLYAMTGHVNRLNLVADQFGDYPGASAEINGAGFAGMKFTAHVGSKDEFNIWVQHTKRTTNVLDAEEYKKLLVPSENNQTIFYSEANQDLYANILLKYSGAQAQQTGY